MRIVAFTVGLLLLLQSSYILAFSMKEGFSGLTLLASAVAFAPLVLLGAVYYGVRRRSSGGRVLALTGAILLGLMEWVLPVSPFKTTIFSAFQNRAIEAVRITAVQDQPFNSASGNPVGVKVKFEAVFPFGGTLSVSPSLRATNSQYNHYATSMSHLANIFVEPEPSKDEAGQYDFQAGARHLFEVEFLPTFIHIARRGVQGLQEGDLCLWETETPTLSVEALRQLLQKPLETAYHVEVAVQGNAYFTSPRLAYEGISDQSYSLKTFFDSALSEEAQPCPW